MKFDEIAKIVDGIPYTSMSKGKTFYDFIIKNDFSNCLELGFAHGTSSCYMAAALNELGGSRKLTCVDLNESEGRDPNLETLLGRAGLLDMVDIVREKNSYNWFLRKQIENQTSEYKCEPLYDFCFIDGPKDWSVDGLAFFLVDKLLKPNGWVMFDDYSWSFENHVKHHGEGMMTSGIDTRELEQDEREVANIKEVFHKLVMQHENYSNFKVEDNILAYAQKVKSSEVKLSFESKASFKYKMLSMAKKMVGRDF